MNPIPIVAGRQQIAFVVSVPAIVVVVTVVFGQLAVVAVENDDVDVGIGFHAFDAPVETAMGGRNVFGGDDFKLDFGINVQGQMDNAVTSFGGNECQLVRVFTGLGLLS